MRKEKKVLHCLDMQCICPSKLAAVFLTLLVKSLRTNESMSTITLYHAHTRNPCWAAQSARKSQRFTSTVVITRDMRQVLSLVTGLRRSTFRFPGLFFFSPCPGLQARIMFPLFPLWRPQSVGTGPRCDKLTCQVASVMRAPARGSFRPERGF